LIAFNDNGEETILGTVTSDSSGMFKKSWTPSVAGEYTIVASFDGTESYWPSSAETAVVVTVASAQPTTEPTTSPSASIPPTESPTQTIAPTPTPAVEPDADNPTDTLLIVGAAVVIIAIVGAAAVLLRKRA
jgi:hypothetical protein